MKLLVTTMCRNEEKIIPYFIHHYSKIADAIAILDHSSTDNTVKIAKEVAAKLNVNLRVDTLDNNGYDDVLLKNVKEKYYKGFENHFDVVIVADTDEFWHHKEGTRDVINSLYNERLTNLVIKPEGYQMASDHFPEYSGKELTSIIRKGSPDKGFDKALCFSTKLNLVGMMGMHNSYHYTNDNIHILPVRCGMKLLHYKFLGLDHRIERIKNSANNLSDHGKELLKRGIAAQFESNNDTLKNEFNHWLERAKDVDI